MKFRELNFNLHFASYQIQPISESFNKKKVAIYISGYFEEFVIRSKIGSTNSQQIEWELNHLFKLFTFHDFIYAFDSSILVFTLVYTCNCVFECALDVSTRGNELLTRIDTFVKRLSIVFQPALYTRSDCFRSHCLLLSLFFLSVWLV